MHAFPEWFMVLMIILSHPVFWVVVVAAGAAVAALVVRAVIRVVRRRLAKGRTNGS